MDKIQTAGCYTVAVLSIVRCSVLLVHIRQIAKDVGLTMEEMPKYR